MLLSVAKKIAEETMALLAPHCARIEIAGSIRRKKAEPGDIELVAIPKPYEVGFMASGITLVLNQWESIKGELPCKYTQRILPCGEKLDFFTATPENWGIIFLIRTGPWEFSKRFVGEWLPRHYYRCEGGYIWDRSRNMVPVPEERDVFKLVGQNNYIEPEFRI